MTEERTIADGLVDSWDSYWQAARHGEAYTGGGSTHPLILSFWDEVFAEARRWNRAPRIADVASGNGALVERAQAAFGEHVDFTCLDISAAAVHGLMQRFAGVKGIVADARTVPLASGTCDMVVSQFGIEYAGLDAVGEAARLVAPGGRLALLVHHREGGIYRQCAASLAAVRMMQDAEFIPLAVDMFETGFALIRGGDRGAYERAGRKMVPAVRAMESIMRRYGARVADEAILKLYRDVKAMHERMQHYDREEVLYWLAAMQNEVTAYAGRMASMCEAAVDETRFAAICGDVERHGFALQRRGPLVDPDRNVPLAWELVADLGIDRTV